MLFGFLKTHKECPELTPAHHPLPATATEHGARVWFEAFGLPYVRQNWSVLLNVLLGVALILLGVLGLRLAARADRAEEGPLLLVADAQTGELRVSQKSLRRFEPDALNKVWFLREWVRMFQTWNAATTKDDLQSAYAWTRGTATAQFKDWVNQNQPVRSLEEDPTLSRDLSNITVNFLENNACVIRYTATTRHGANLPEAPQKYVLSANYVLTQPKNERELEQAGNPLGLSITHFTIARETER
jgi:type IV secretory pathway TrbF-like protein